eukprot:GDKI01006714.1.p1 GENE.GDKI01006714.1~~GDKI01006714.1.p1  ORF type:complete len:157 (+),score=53.60 GDKI01006714.1:65-535(+)
MKVAFLVALVCSAVVSVFAKDPSHVDDKMAWARGIIEKRLEEMVRHQNEEVSKADFCKAQIAKADESIAALNKSIDAIMAQKQAKALIAFRRSNPTPDAGELADLEKQLENTETIRKALDSECLYMGDSAEQRKQRRDAEIQGLKDAYDALTGSSA